MNNDCDVMVLRAMIAVLGQLAQEQGLSRERLIEMTEQELLAMNAGRGTWGVWHRWLREADERGK